MCLKAYAAGIMDGDGSIQIQERLNGSHRLIVYLSGCDDRPHYMLKDRWGGGVTHTATMTGRGYFRWHLTTDAAVEFLEDILPFLIVKKEQAELALKFQSEKPNREGSQTMRASMRALSKRGA